MYRTEQEQKDLCEIEIRAKDGVRRRETKLMTYSTNTSIWGRESKGAREGKHTCQYNENNSEIQSDY